MRLGGRILPSPLLLGILLGILLLTQSLDVRADSCNDGIMNCPGCEESSDPDCTPCEFGIDCGGPCPESCDPCNGGKECGNVIQACASCFNGCLDGDETGIDCGGSCVRVLNGVEIGKCPTCSDGIQNGDETGVDCGGSCVQTVNGEEIGKCPTCSDGIKNGDELGVDCGGSCGGVCPTCSDFVRNGDETGIDCGGSCLVLDGDGEVISGACPTCGDGIKNGDELGVDCGGSCGGVCPTCTDKIKNGDEEDVDCGGSCPKCPECDDGIQNGDEEGVDCGGTCPDICPTCKDGVQNGDEEGVDCGGSCPNYICPSCFDGIKNGNEEGVDCGGDCEQECEPTCDDGIQNGQEEAVDCGGPDCNCCEEHCEKMVNLGHALLNFTLCPEILSSPVLESKTDGLAVQEWISRAGKVEYSGPEVFAEGRVIFRHLERVLPGRCTTFFIFIFQAYDPVTGAVDPTERRPVDIAESISGELQNPNSLSLGAGFAQRGHLYILDYDYGVNITTGAAQVTVCRDDPGQPIVWGGRELCPGYQEEKEDFPWEYIAIGAGSLLGVCILGYVIYRLFFKKQDVLKASSTEMVARDTAEAELDQLSDEDDEDQLA